MKKNNKTVELVQVNKECKKELRSRILSERRQLSVRTIDVLSAKIAESFIRWDIYNAAKSIMLYVPMPDEPQIASVFEHAWDNNKSVSIPYLSQSWGIMDAAAIHSFEELVPGKIKNLKVPNPEKLCIVDSTSIDLILIPGVAFDQHGYRLGMGAGYYDRFLPKALQAKTVGVCWSANVLQTLPRESHDLPVEYLLTEMGIFNCIKGKM